MKKFVLILTATLATTGMGVVPVFSGPASLCTAKDKVCRELESLANAEQFAAIAGKVDKTREYSKESRHYIGRAYLALAAAENNTPEQEEAFCRKALEFGSTQAYMGLYFIYAQKDKAAALGYLRQYIATKPADSVPYVILGESELEKMNYRLADEYLRESKKVARASSPRVDWMLFKANYLLGNYEYASQMFESATQNGRFDDELKSIAADGRFHGIQKRPEFQKHQQLFAEGNRHS